MAIAAIHQFFVAKNAPKTVEQKFLLAPRDANAKSKEANFQGRFAGLLNTLKNTPRTLFANGAPAREGIQQRGIGDCYLVSMLGTFATYHPDRMRSMIHEEKDGAYMVHFPGSPPIRVQPLTDAQIVLIDNTAGQQGLWLKVMVEAHAIQRRKSHGNPKVALDDLGGGNSRPIISMLTGQKEDQIKHFAFNPKNNAKIEMQVARALRTVQEQKVLASTGTGGKTPGNGPLPPGIVGGHAYGVLGYAPAKKLVTIWNPWGDDWEPKGTPGIQNGYPRKGGVFTMPLQDFMAVFGGLDVQASAPTTKLGVRARAPSEGPQFLAWRSGSEKIVDEHMHPRVRMCVCQGRKRQVLSLRHITSQLKRNAS